jgi:hypothetical protein
MDLIQISLDVAIWRQKYILTFGNVQLLTFTRTFSAKGYSSRFGNFRCLQLPILPRSSIVASR